MPRANTQQSPDDPAELQKYVERVGRESVASEVKRARRLPIQRDAVLRPGAQLNQRIVVNKVALLLYRRGTIAEVKYFACQRGEGPLVECVRQFGFMDGCCANCYYEHCNSKCNFENRKKTIPILRPFMNYRQVIINTQNLDIVP